MKKLPYQVLMEQHNLTESDLPKDVLELVKTLKKKVTFAENKGDDSKATLDSIDSFDKFICTGIFNFLDEKKEDEKKEKQRLLDEAQKEAEANRLAEEERLRKEKEEQGGGNPPPTPPTPPTPDKKGGRIGFFGF